MAKGQGGKEARNRDKTIHARAAIWQGKPIEFLIDAMTNGRVPKRDLAGRITDHEEIDTSERLKIAQYLGNKILPNLASVEVDASVSTEGTMILQLAPGTAPHGALKTIDATATEVEPGEPAQIEDATPIETVTSAAERREEPQPVGSGTATPASTRPRRKRRGEQSRA